MSDTASVKSGKNKSDTASIKSGKSKSSLKAFAEYLASQDDDADLTDDSGDKGEAHAQFSFVQSSTAYIFKQDKSHGLDLRKVILLDSQSTVDLFCNADFVTNIRESPRSMRLQSNGGQMLMRQKATVQGYQSEVWFSNDAVCNIMGLCNVKRQYRVTYDSDATDHFTVHRRSHGHPDMHFYLHPCGLHIFDPSDAAFTFVNTVSGNKENFSQRQIKGAESARRLYTFLKYPSLKDFKWIVQGGSISNNDVTLADIDVATKIWGPNIAALKGKTTRTTPSPVAADFLKVPQAILDLHREVSLSADIFFVNGIPFLLTFSRNICFTTVSHLGDRQMSTIFAAYQATHQFYLKRGFHITLLNVDGDAALQALVHDMPQGPRVNLTSANEHVPDAEWRIRVVKERVRASRHDLPYPRIPKILLVHMVLECVKILNYFPTKGSFSDTISPRLLMTGEGLDVKKHFRVLFGAYCQIHDEAHPRNSLLPRTTGAICLGHIVATSKVATGSSRSLLDVS